MGNTNNPDDFFPLLRLAFIERKAQAKGWIQRSDLQEAFGMSQAQASADFRVFTDLHPKALSYSLSRKRYEWIGGARLKTKLPWPVKELDI